MTTALQVSELALINDMQRLDILSHNLANATTAGFKREQAVTRLFGTLFDSQFNTMTAGAAVSPWAPSVETQADHAPGALHFTGNPLDLAIEGEGFFELLGSEGASYTRRGAFTLDAAGRLVNDRGLVVNGEEGELLLRGGNVTVDRQGRVYEEGDYAGQLRVVGFNDAGALQRRSGGLWVPAAGQRAQPLEAVAIRQGYAEASNVNVMEEMVAMMTTLRHFETTSKVLKGYDDMIGSAISTIAEF
ncbi:flagellar hook-basal body protein [Exilibacterium tricleocarpae]|uniref:Flagellar hook-basal body protein n=1 Tax=Exilibacterium tricleocarpae TaxID=2591008 RepID=A0A545T856_9GAMM|nr:flagellar hook-basal body protein [Exilibacterium tricleocarpae]TQV73402.1 flagellar hook-basal body protein [Exilibacterium tricleocarpae]